MWKTTHWSQILEAQNKNSAALETLCRDYWLPVCKSVQRYDKENAEDLTQEFFTTFLENKWIQRVSQTKGKFRTFILVALARFLKDKFHKKQNAFENSIVHSYDFLEKEMEKGFNRYWIEKLLDIVDNRMHVQYEKQATNDYFIFKSYYQYSHRILFQPSSFVQIDVLIHELQKENVNMRNSNVLSLTRRQKYEFISQELNRIIENDHLPHKVFEEDYCFYGIDFKNRDWGVLKKRLEEHFQHLSPNSTIVANKKSICAYLNNFILTKNSICGSLTNSVYDKRSFLEDTFSDYIEKCILRHNREYLSQKYKSFCMPLFREKPSFLALAEYFSMTKYQVEQTLEKMIDMYRQIMRDEVSRYVCPENVSEEIKYLQNIL
ncbi:RNA polymerase sigma factor [Candidatus Uabimicrobium amorphum]|uniref:RNA polymerase subunit sigma-24 n=1 Tax=Uabimicrobium amorphum TaxID=2596890 RepID=A0A5S9ILF1_UABAM|nr:hypothetical protein [Candidatus Uabimicrobium amorphum]BBM83874.1 RNA polymerase subunit sigma-24 [Candidatus Uabimicrobium amorphum]